VTNATADKAFRSSLDLLNEEDRHASGAFDALVDDLAAMFAKAGVPGFHHYGRGGWQGRGADAEVQRVEHYLTVNVTNNGKTISTTRMPLTGAGAPIVPAGGGSPFNTIGVP
jgi:hypothetical protein